MFICLIWVKIKKIRIWKKLNMEIFFRPLHFHTKWGIDFKLWIKYNEESLFSPKYLYKYEKKSSINIQIHANTVRANQIF